MSQPSTSTSGASIDPSGSNGPDPSSAGTLPTVPWAFIDCPTDTLIVLISHMLSLLIQHNDQVVLTPDALTRFHSRAAPGISVLEYLRRIVKYTNMEKIPLLSLLAYIDITCQHLPTFTLSSLTVHRFLIAGVCAGSKAQCDVFCTNAHYAKVGGIKVQELNALEREFLKVTQWNLCCNADLLQRYYSSLIRSHGGFTQLPEPSVIPFKAFPRSLSKPRGEDADEEMGEPEQDVSVEDDAVEAASPSSSKRRSLDVSGMVEDNGVEVSPGSSSARGRGRRSSERRRSSRGDQGMEVDQDESPSSPVSPATSSIPSSSRSSLRGGSRGRGRTLSLSYTDARPAEPRLDRTTASGSPFKSPRDAAKSPLKQSSQSKLSAASAASAIEEEDQASRATNGRHADEHEHHTHDHHHHHDHHGAHLLKSLVGGIFHRRKSTHADKPTPPPPPNHPTVRNGSGEGDAHNGHRVLPSQPVRRPPTHAGADIPPPAPPSRIPSTAAPLPPPSASSAVAPPGQIPPMSRNSSLTRSPMSMRSPGIAKPVTPKIRTFEEMGEVPTG